MTKKSKNWITIDQASGYTKLSHVTIRRLIKKERAKGHYRKTGKARNSTIVIDPDFLKREYNLPDDYTVIKQMSKLDQSDDYTGDGKRLYDGLLDTIETLKKQLEVKDRQIEELQESERRKDILILEFQKKIPMLEAKTSPRGEDENKSLWEKMRFWKKTK